MPPEVIKVVETPEERVDNAIIQIRKICEGTNDESIQAEALGHMVTFVGLGLEKPDKTVMSIHGAIIERRRNDNATYFNVSGIFEHMIVSCLSDDERSLDARNETARSLSKKLHMLLGELYPGRFTNEERPLNNLS